MIRNRFHAWEKLAYWSFLLHDHTEIQTYRDSWFCATLMIVEPLRLHHLPFHYILFGTHEGHYPHVVQINTGAGTCQLINEDPMF